MKVKFCDCGTIKPKNYSRVLKQTYDLYDFLKKTMVTNLGSANHLKTPTLQPHHFTRHHIFLEKRFFLK